MTGTAAETFGAHNPIDRVEKLAEQLHWNLDRTGDDEGLMIVSGGWCDLHLSLSWRLEMEALVIASVFDLKVPDKRRDEVMRLLSLINGQLVHGHFDLWRADGSVVHRDSLILAGGAEANDAQCEALIRGSLDACQKFYPALQFVIWAGHSAQQAMSSALLETHGEA